MNDKVLSNKRISWLIGPETSIANWLAPSLANVASLLNMSAGIRIAGTDFGVQATEMTDDRSFADEAGAQELGYAAFGGNVSTFIPPNDDAGSIERVTHNTFKKPRTRLAVGQRFGIEQSIPVAAGDEVNLFRTITDAEIVERRQTGYSTTTEMVGQDDNLINYILPPAAPVAVTVGGTSGGTAGQYGLLSAVYQGIPVTTQVTWTSSNPAVAEVNAAGVVRYLSAGAATITAAYPGGTSGTKALTVT
ncbi:MAG: hypothetical protein K0S37_4088 [Microbacterium sp.]|jgi:hypothetical protein|nr:hypothetical protein [Microbacterium sp.]